MLQQEKEVTSRSLTSRLHASMPPPPPSSNHQNTSNCGHSRRDILWKYPAAAATALLALTPVSPPAAQALVKGVAPPPKKKLSNDGRPKCTNVEECQEAAAKREQLLREEAEKQQELTPTQVTAGGTRYREMEDEPGMSPSQTDGKVVQNGDNVGILFKVLKLGKRSFDGLSGEGTVVFSRGYGLEDDEDSKNIKSFFTTVGNYNNVEALNEALVGMKVGGQRRRFEVRPEKGWRKPGKICDGGPGGSGTGGSLKTDYVVVPTATMVAEEACFDATKQPFPSTYAQQRRMAQRFDQSLIMEVQVVSIN